MKTTVDNPASMIPFKVRLEPYLVESICELARLTGGKGHHQADVSGLLFGRVDDGTRTAEALKTFADVGTHSELARRERWERAYRTTLEESRGDAELSAFDVVGWFSFRTGTGLLSSDVVFHNQHFRKPEDLALIICREGSSQITVEVYSKAESDSLTSDDYRWGSVRFSSDIRHMREPVELAMRVKLSEDSYLRAYDTEQPSGLERLRQRAESVSDRLLGFLHLKKDPEYRVPVRGYIDDGRPVEISEHGENYEQFGSGQSYLNPFSEAALERAATRNQKPAPSESVIPEPVPAVAAAAAASVQAVPMKTAAPVPMMPVEASRPARMVPAERDVRMAMPAPTARAQAASGYGTAPKRIAEPAVEVPAAEAQYAELPSYELSSFELANIGRAPRTGRAPQREVGGLPMLLRPPAPRPKPFPWVWATGLFVLCSVIVFALLTTVGLQGDGGRMGEVFQSLLPGGADLGLKVRNEDDRLRLSWNQRNRSVMSASGATLEISDGQQHRQIRLDGRQVADGSVLYRPITSDVTFRLDVRGEQGDASGSVRVLDGLAGQRPVLDVSSAATVPVESASAHAPLSADPAIAEGLPQGGLNSEAAPLTAKQDATPDTAAAKTPAGSSAIPPIIETPYVPLPTAPTRSNAAAGKRTPPVYQSQQASGTPTPAGGTTINGWDSSSLRSKNRAKIAAAVPVATTGYVPPRPVMQVMPNTRSIPNGTIQGRTRVEVQVDVDQTGRVAAAHVVSTGVNDRISAAALSAARQWTFDAAMNNGQRVDSVHTIVFEFKP